METQFAAPILVYRKSVCNGYDEWPAIAKESDEWTEGEIGELLAVRFKEGTVVKR